jgi:hypothetical protein
MRRTVLLMLMVMVATLVVASGVTQASKEML